MKEMIISKIEELLETQVLSKSVRNILTKVLEELKSEQGDLKIRISALLYEIEEVSSDINLPPHLRSILWNIMSDLERLRSMED